MIDALEGMLLRCFLIIFSFPFFLTHFDDAWAEMIVTQFQSTHTPVATQSKHTVESLFTELRVVHRTISWVLIRIRSLVTPSPVPQPTFLIASKIYRVATQITIAMILSCCIHTDVTLHQRWSIVKHEYTCHRIRTIHQRGWSFHDFYGMYRLTIDFHAMLIAPLLSFLAHTTIHYQHTIIA